MKNITIIGSSGYIGSSLYQYLSKFDDFNIFTVDVEYFGNTIKNNNHQKLYYTYLTEKFISKQDIFILCAGHSSVKMSQNDPDGAFFNNVVNFFQFLRKINKSQLFLYCSSSSVYSGINGEYLSEENICYRPQNIYDLTKAHIDQYAILSDTTYFGLRLGTVAGAIGPYTNLRVDTCLNGFINTYKTNGTINIFDGHIKRPIAGINDVCRAIKTIIDNGDESNKGIYNICSTNTSINNLGNIVSKILNCPINYVRSTNNHLYDFTINTSKFALNFDFAFEDTIESIIKSLEDNWLTMNKGVRNSVPERKILNEH